MSNTAIINAITHSMNNDGREAIINAYDVLLFVNGDNDEVDTLLDVLSTVDGDASKIAETSYLKPLIHHLKTAAFTVVDTCNGISSTEEMPDRLIVQGEEDGCGVDGDETLKWMVTILFV
jgi:hypothetical protein